MKGDGDDDDSIASERAGVHDRDNDGDGDAIDDELKPYLDSDDAVALRWGRQASAAQRREITSVIGRYYAAAAAADGAKACALMYPILAEAIPEDYGQAPGPQYARGTTCAAVMSKIFLHNRGRLTTAVEVRWVRIAGNRARATLGSEGMPASFIALHRAHGAWMIAALLGTTLP